MDWFNINIRHNLTLNLLINYTRTVLDTISKTGYKLTITSNFTLLCL